MTETLDPDRPQATCATHGHLPGHDGRCMFCSADTVTTDPDRQLVERLAYQARYGVDDIHARGLGREAAAALTRLLDERDQCATYLKAGETPAECIARNRADVDTVLGLLAKEKVAHEAARDQMQALEAERDAGESKNGGGQVMAGSEKAVQAPMRQDIDSMETQIAALHAGDTIEGCRLLTVLGGWDPESAHVYADEILLKLVGCDVVRAAFDEVPKWYS